MVPKLLPIDEAYLQRILLDLLAIPSPTGRVDDVMRVIGEEIEALGMPVEITRRGVLHATLRGTQYALRRMVLVHADTIGAMVKGIRPNGRLRLVSIGTWSARFAEGSRVTIFTDAPGRTYTGTILPLKASGHTFDTEVDTQPVAWDNLEVRIDEPVSSADQTRALGIDVGDFVAVDPNPVITPTGYVNSRHLDDKAGVAAALAAFKALRDAELEVPVTCSLSVTVAEEVGLGATNVGTDIAEAVSIDAALCAEGQQSREDMVNIALHDSSGPFDYHLSRRLIRICEDLAIPYRRDLFTYYRSDIAAALEAGAEMRAALIGFGTDASHGWERTHLDGLRRVAELVAAYVQTPLLFRSDTRPTGPLQDFPDQEQPPDP